MSREDHEASREELYQELIDRRYTFRATSDGARVFIGGDESRSIGEVAHENGYTIYNVESLDEDDQFDAKVDVMSKEYARNLADKEEENHRDTSPRVVGDDE